MQNLRLLYQACLIQQACDEVQRFLPAGKTVQAQHIMLMAVNDPQGLRGLL
jgi:hypothetical protein